MQNESVQGILQVLLGNLCQSVLLIDRVCEDIEPRDEVLKHDVNEDDCVLFLIRN